ncbi:hypothetical protein [Calidithermus chliarophilus]|uniref:hypothetical protein n=1 Tax=Calidithermus chliarophilus TaxID=52023 RepID=UPI0012F675BA|nr:hypothetical protein [Calidithermus chliarophilus]
MYNLDVAVADTFYVGEGQWLVHNCETVAFGLQARGLQNFANQQGAKTFADLGLNPTSETFMDDFG